MGEIRTMENPPEQVHSEHEERAELKKELTGLIAQYRESRAQTEAFGERIDQAIRRLEAKIGVALSEEEGEEAEAVDEAA